MDEWRNVPPLGEPCLERDEYQRGHSRYHARHYVGAAGRRTEIGQQEHSEHSPRTNAAECPPGVERVVKQQETERHTYTGYAYRHARQAQHQYLAVIVGLGRETREEIVIMMVPDEVTLVATVDIPAQNIEAISSPVSPAGISLIMK